MLLADALVVPEGNGDSFWTEEAKALLQGLILYVATDEREAGMRHLGRVRDLLLLDGEDMPLLFQRMTESAHHVVTSTGARSLQKEEKLLANVIASAQAQTHFLDSPRIRESLSASDFKFEDLKSSAMTIYLVLPADRLATFGRWLRLLIQQAITVNARNIAQRPALPVLFLLDEMPALGRLSMVEQAYRLMAGFGIQIWGIAQDASGLKAIYGEGWEGFVANAGAIQYYGSLDRMTAEYFSALCGESTVASMANAAAVAMKSWSLAPIQDSTQTNAGAQRKLAYPDELMRLANGRQLVLIENHPPIQCEKRPWFTDDALRPLGRDLHAEGMAK
jgi:type IV secretion system protein VirD4